MSALKGLVLPIATYLGLQLADKAPPVRAVTMGVALVKIVDQYAADSAEQSVRDIYRNKDGSDPPIILLTQYEPSKETFDGKFVSKDDMQKWVDRHGGTAWGQVGSNGRILMWWHPSRSFKPKDPSKPLSAKLSIGHVVRGTKDAK